MPTIVLRVISNWNILECLLDVLIYLNRLSATRYGRTIYELGFTKMMRTKTSNHLGCAKTVPWQQPQKE